MPMMLITLVSSLACVSKNLAPIKKNGLFIFLFLTRGVLCGCETVSSLSPFCTACGFPCLWLTILIVIFMVPGYELIVIFMVSG